MLSKSRTILRMRAKLVWLIYKTSVNSVQSTSSIVTLSILPKHPLSGILPQLLDQNTKISSQQNFLHKGSLTSCIQYRMTWVASFLPTTYQDALSYLERAIPPVAVVFGENFNHLLLSKLLAKKLTCNLFGNIFTRPSYDIINRMDSVKCQVILVTFTPMY